jgi:hypothetical protein
LTPVFIGFIECVNGLVLPLPQSKGSTGPPDHVLGTPLYQLVLPVRGDIQPAVANEENNPTNPASASTHVAFMKLSTVQYPSRLPALGSAGGVPGARMYPPPGKY